MAFEYWWCEGGECMSEVLSTRNTYEVMRSQSWKPQDPVTVVLVPTLEFRSWWWALTSDTQGLEEVMQATFPVPRETSSPSVRLFSAISGRVEWACPIDGASTPLSQVKPTHGFPGEISSQHTQQWFKQVSRYSLCLTWCCYPGYNRKHHSPPSVRLFISLL